MTADCIDLYELQQQLRDGLEELFPGRIWVRAEIASIQAKANGHCYLYLSQSGDTVASGRRVGAHLPA